MAATASLSVPRLLLVAVLLSPLAAQAYPVSSPFVDLVEAQDPGTWLKVNTNHFQDVWVQKSQRSSPGASYPRYVISAWSGGGYDSNTGDFYVWGGDNATYSGNEMYRWRASTLNWERLSLPSAIISDSYYASGKKLWRTVDGTNNAPISGETFDNVVYLPGVDRLAVIGGNAYPGDGRQYVLEDGSTRAGPFFFDPSRGDSNKVGGLTGSHVNPTLFPDVVGGRMWENRQSIEPEHAAVFGSYQLAPRVSATTTIGGKDVVFVGEHAASKRGRLFKYTVNSLDASEDEWELVGIMGSKTYSGTGAGAYDSTRNIFLRTGAVNHLFYDETTGTYVKRGAYSLMYWDLDNAGPDNKVTYIHPQSMLGEVLPLSNKFGMDYDPITDAYYLWSGLGEIWKVTPPSDFGPEGWFVERVAPFGIGPTLEGSKFSGIFGKWNYMPDLGAFMGVAHDLTGDVWIYKPEISDFLTDNTQFARIGTQGHTFEELMAGSILLSRVPEPGTASLLLLGWLVFLFRKGAITKKSPGRLSRQTDQIA